MSEELSVSIGNVSFSCDENDNKNQIVDLIQQRKDLLNKLKHVELQIKNICGSVSQARSDGGFARVGRPKGSTNKKSLDSVIISNLETSTNGLSLDELVKNIVDSGQLANSSAKNFMGVIRSRISVLKKLKKISRSPETLKFSKYTPSLGEVWI